MNKFDKKNPDLRQIVVTRVKYVQIFFFKQNSSVSSFISILSYISHKSYANTVDVISLFFNKTARKSFFCLYEIL